MITAVDTNVILDVLTADPRFGTASREALRHAWHAGALVACDVVWAEMHAAAGAHGAAALATLGVRFDALTSETAAAAGSLWRAWRAKGGDRRERILADFLIGAHGGRQADALLTRDRGFYRRCFPDLRIVEPTA